MQLAASGRLTAHEVATVALRHETAVAMKGTYRFHLTTVYFFKQINKTFAFALMNLFMNLVVNLEEITDFIINKIINQLSNSPDIYCFSIINPLKFRNIYGPSIFSIYLE